MTDRRTKVIAFNFIGQARNEAAALSREWESDTLARLAVITAVQTALDALRREWC